MPPRCMLALFFLISAVYGSPCIPRHYGTHDIVCVCNTTYCDDIEPIGTFGSDQAVLYLSSESGLRMARSLLTATSTPTYKIQISIDGNKRYQTIKGFGTAFTDAAGINMMSLPSNMRETILRQYFSPDGLGYTIGRVPIASCDFSTHQYSYDDVPGDLAMSNFNLTMEDFVYKIPFIKRAIQFSNSQLKLFASPWSAPGWMKTNDQMAGGGLLDGPIDGPYYESWANYLVKFFESYYDQGINFWGLTAQNEPTTGSQKNWWQTLYFNASMQRDFIKTYLGPKLTTNPITRNINLMIMDDQRSNLPAWPTTILSDPAAAEFVSGIAIHWYEDAISPAVLLTETHNRWPNTWMLGTEACNGFLTGGSPPLLGNWLRGALYAHDIIVDLNNWVTGWTDWNFCLDLKGGPNWANNTVDAPIIVNSTAQEYYKQPMFYTLAHFSKFLTPGSVRCDAQLTNFPTATLLNLPFIDPQGRKGIVLSNTAETKLDVSVSDYNVPNKWYNFEMEQNSLATILFN